MVGRAPMMAWVAAVALAAAAPRVTHAYAGPGSAEQAETLYVAALAAKDEGDAAKAAALFEEAYRALPPDKQASETGQTWVVEEAHVLYVQGYAETHSVALLEADQALLRDFIQTVDGAGDRPGVPATDKARQTLTSVDEFIALHYRAQTEPDTGDPVVPIETVDPPDDPPPEPQEPTDGRRPGVGLIVAGASLTAVGVAVILVGASRVPWARAILDPNADPDDNDQFVARRELERNIMLGLGIPMAVIGGGLLAWGAVRISRRRSGSARLRLGPGPTVAGLGAQLRF